ncbi:GroES-like protein [Mycena chlorophos]|uniref:GroES-like protein n=1 Tax=Mycena chlorophos TaxID=658473 RepID=A0A8H6WPN2_MYCCL|nr:GroES-like protein [Mycena chlorophos]
MSQLALIYEAQSKHVIGELPIPEPLAGYLQVRVEAAAVNPSDYKIFDFDLGGFVKHYPAVLGWEAAGVVTKIADGEKTKFKVGDRVAFICVPSFSVDGGASYTSRGAFQQYALADQRFSIKIPAGLDYAEASSWPMAGNTAAGVFYKHLQLKEPWVDGKDAYKGQKLVILGGSSSVGSYAIQFAVISGFEVITTASPAHFEYLKSLGANTVIDRAAPDAAAQLLAAAGGPLKYVVDAISIAATQSLAIEILEENGFLGLVLSPAEPVKPLMEAKNVQVRFGTGLAGWYASPALHEAAEGYFAAGTLKFNRATVLGGLEAWEEAFEMHRKGTVSGTKIVLAPQQTRKQSSLL